MKVFFVGEGPHDIGSPEFAPRPSRAHGVIPTLARKVSPEIGIDSIGMFWREIPVLNRNKRKNGFAAKVSSAILLAVRHKCEGTICVTDRDTDEARLAAMEEGVDRGLAAVGATHRVACGIAIESVEAWMLGSPSALASVLQKTVEDVTQDYKPHAVEEMHPRSGKPEKRSKDLLAKIAKTGHRDDDTPFREEVAENANIDELTRHCKDGFKPFAEKLRAAFGPRPN